MPWMAQIPLAVLLVHRPPIHNPFTPTCSAICLYNALSTTTYSVGNCKRLLCCRFRVTRWDSVRNLGDVRLCNFGSFWEVQAKNWSVASACVVLGLSLSPTFLRFGSAPVSHQQLSNVNPTLPDHVDPRSAQEKTNNETCHVFCNIALTVMGWISKTNLETFLLPKCVLFNYSNSDYFSLCRTCFL